MKNNALLIIALALVACGKSDKKPAENADPVENKGGTKSGETKAGGDDNANAGGELKAPAFDCGSLVTAAEVETACGTKGTVEKLPGEGTTETAGNSKLLHVCYRDIKFGPDSHVTLAVNFVGGEQTGEDIVRANMEAAGTAGWGKKIKSMTGYVGMPPSTDTAQETAELRGLVRGTMVAMTSTHKTGEPWGCNEDGLSALSNVLVDRVPAAPSR